MANLYYREDLTAADARVGAIVEVTGDEAHHAVRVSRLRLGEHIWVGNGSGLLARGEVTEVAKQRFAVRVDEVSEHPEPAPRLTLVQALAKGDRDERAVEQSTEFGVDAIVPWAASRSVSRWSDPEKTARGVAKWQRTAREAAKQSLRPAVPAVRQPLGLDGLRALCAQPDTRVLVLHPRGERTLTAWARAHVAAAEVSAEAGQTASVTEIALVIGPEGGFSDEELDALAAAGAEVLLLGSTVLRTSSAGPAGLAVLNAALGRW